MGVVHSNEHLNGSITYGLGSAPGTAGAAQNVAQVAGAGPLLVEATGRKVSPGKDGDRAGGGWTGCVPTARIRTHAQSLEGAAWRGRREEGFNEDAPLKGGRGTGGWSCWSQERDLGALTSISQHLKNKRTSRTGKHAASP